MTQAQARSPIFAVLTGIWDAMNFFRRLVFNLAFYGFLFFLMFALLASLFASAGSSSSTALDERTTLVLAPEGRVVEQFTTDPATRAFAQALGDDSNAEVQLRDLLRVLEAAKTDKKIERVLLRLDGLSFSGYASLREVSAAIADLRASGKQVVAFGESYDQVQYLLAANANEIYLDPMGGLLMEGLSRYRQYYREGLQDKLGVDVHLFKVGEYKSAAEPYVLDAASPEAKEADLFWMNDIWQRHLGAIAKSRKLDPKALAADIDNLAVDIPAAGGDLAQYALKKKLVDGLKTEEQLEELLAERGVADEDSPTGFRAIGYQRYLAHLSAEDMPGEFASGPQVGVVVAEGNIVGGEQPPGSVGGESTAAQLRDMREDEDIKAVVLRVNSPGGDVFASEQIRREVELLKKAGKPVVASMGDYAASGGYWISMNADTILADESTVTGSIGIFGLVPTVSRTLEQVGVRTDGVSTTKFAGAFDLTRPLSPEVGTIIQSVIDKGYRDFTGRVATARKKPVEAVDAVARGRVWTGAQARERGLVDGYGGLRAAILEAAKRAKLGKPDAYDVRYSEPETTPFQRWLGSLAQGGLGRALLADSDLARGLLKSALPNAEHDLQVLREAAQARGGSPVKAFAHCFCEF